jgi:hypothetical protein
VSWTQFFHEPIELPDGRVLRSLRDAVEFIQSLPNATNKRPEWKEAVKALLLFVDHDGDTLLVRRAIMKALRAGGSLEPKPRRKRAKKHRIIR